MITVTLHGALAERFAAPPPLAVASPAEAIRALCLMLPGFRAALEASNVEIIAGDLETGRAVEVATVRERFRADERELHIAPAVEGAEDVGKIVVGALLIGASFLIPGVGPIAVQIGLGLVLGGVSGLLAPSPPRRERREEAESSSLYGDQANTATPATPLPVLFGECVVGSVVISASVVAERRA